MQGAQREEPQQQSIDLYRQRNLEYSNSNVKQWFINRYFYIDKDWADEEKINWDTLLENLPKIAPKGSDFEYLT